MLKTPSVLEPLLSVSDVAAVLGCTRRTVERLRSSGNFPGPDLQVGKLPRWEPETVRAWIRAGGSA